MTVAEVVDNSKDLKQVLFKSFKKGQIPDMVKMKLKQYFNHPDKNGKAINVHIETEKVHWAVQKWRECTSTSPLGQDLGHYHMEFLPGRDEEYKQLTEMFLAVQMHIINLAIQNNVVLCRWNKVHTLMHPKDGGVTKLH